MVVAEMEGLISTYLQNNKLRQGGDPTILLQCFLYSQRASQSYLGECGIFIDSYTESNLDGSHGRPNLKDPLQVPDESITRSRAKKIKEAIQGLMQSTWAEFANFSNKTPTFKMGLKEEESTLIHVIQTTDGSDIA
jgi:hypothetical protein